MDSTEMSGEAKSRALEQLYKKQMKKDEPQKSYIVTRKGKSRSTGQKGRAKHVDARMKKDMRGAKADDKKRGKKRKK